MFSSQKSCYEFKVSRYRWNCWNINCNVLARARELCKTSEMLFSRDLSKIVWIHILVGTYSEFIKNRKSTNRPEVDLSHISPRMGLVWYFQSNTFFESKNLKSLIYIDYLIRPKACLRTAEVIPIYFFKRSFPDQLFEGSLLTVRTQKSL